MALEHPCAPVCPGGQELIIPFATGVPQSWLSHPQLAHPTPLLSPCRSHPCCLPLPPAPSLTSLLRSRAPGRPSAGWEQALACRSLSISRMLSWGPDTLAADRAALLRVGTPGALAAAGTWSPRGPPPHNGLEGTMPPHHKALAVAMGTPMTISWQSPVETPPPLPPPHHSALLCPWRSPSLPPALRAQFLSPAGSGFLGSRKTLPLPSSGLLCALPRQLLSLAAWISRHSQSPGRSPQTCWPGSPWAGQVLQDTSAEALAAGLGG